MVWGLALTDATPCQSILSLPLGNLPPPPNQLYKIPRDRKGHGDGINLRVAFSPLTKRPSGSCIEQSGGGVTSQRRNEMGQFPQYFRPALLYKPYKCCLSCWGLYYSLLLFHLFARDKALNIDEPRGIHRTPKSQEIKWQQSGFPLCSRVEKSQWRRNNPLAHARPRASSWIMSNEPPLGVTKGSGPFLLCWWFGGNATMWVYSVGSASWHISHASSGPPCLACLAWIDRQQHVGCT